MNKNILAIDGNSILNRAFYGVKPLSTADGRPTNAIFGFVNIVMKAVQSISPDGVAVAFDMRAPTFRHKECDFYKANRHGMPEELAAQMPYAKDIARAFGFKVFEIEGYEADDILGTCARCADEDADNDYMCYILTGDRDSFQLVSEKCNVLLAGNNDTTLYDLDKINEVYGLPPKKLIDVKSLMGDTSDNIPGVAGIGEKTALKLISEFGDLDNLYEKYADSKLSAGVKAKLERDKEMAYKSRFLAEIFTSVPLALTYSDISGIEQDGSALFGLFADLELRSFIKRFGLEGETAPEKDGEEASAHISVEKNIVPKEGIPEGEELYVHMDIAEQLIYLSPEGEELYEVPLAKAYMEKIFSTERRIVCYNTKDTAVMLLREGVIPTGFADDISLMSYVANPADKHEACEVYERVMGEILPSENTSAYLCLCMKEIAEKLTSRLEKDGSLSLYRDIELPLATVLAKMETRGMKLDDAGLIEYGKKIDARLNERQANIYFLAGEEFNINSPKQLGDILFGKLGLHGFKKTKNGYSTDAETLEKLRPYHPIVNEILDFRLVSKLRSTYVEGLLSALSSDGRLHTVFKQSLTLTGRLSSAEPNLQNIPIRKPEGRELRRFFIPENPSRVLLDADYSQIELRILAAISGDETMINAFKDGIDIHTVTASQVFGLPIEMINSELRKKAKAVNFGIVYGISDFSLAGDLGISIKEAGDYIKSYFAKYPKVEEYLDTTVTKATESGFVTTLYGRRRYIPELISPKKPMQAFGKRVAMNTPIQGSAADIIKIAMIRVEKALEEAGLDAKLILQVHDELIVESSKSDAEAAGAILRREMENAASLSVPLEVDLQIAENWFDAHN